MWPWSKKKSEPEPSSSDLGSLLVQVAAHECQTLQSLWKRTLDDEAEVWLFAELGILLLAIADRLAYSTHGEPVRSRIMNPAVDTFRDCFANQKHFGVTEHDRATHFEHLLAERFQKFAACSSIGGDSQDSLLFTGARHLTETFLADVPATEQPEWTFETGKVLGTCLASLLQVPSFQALGTKG